MAVAMCGFKDIGNTHAKATCMYARNGDATVTAGTCTKADGEANATMVADIMTGMSGMSDMTVMDTTDREDRKS